MFTKHSDSAFLELSNDLQDEVDWVIGHLRTFDVPLDVAAFAIEPFSKLLAVGTSSGSIFVHGGPGVEVKVNTPVSVGVKFLAFSLPAKSLLCIDDQNSLHVWSLATFGAPEYLVSSRFDQVNSLQASSSSCHAFIGLQSGEIKTYDLACLRKSPYIVPNLWKLYQQSQRVGGLSPLVEEAPTASEPCVDQVLHPRDLNQIFVAYSSGVILSNITDRSTVRAYELILPPGAPGGGGYGAGDILTHRRSGVTCISVHPSGHILAAGHSDGSISFWAVEDDAAPLTVFTFDEDDVHLVHSEKLEAHLQNQDLPSQTISIREPVIKLAWSGYSNSTDPRGGETTLTVLGGLDAARGGRITVLWFPPFQPTEPPPDQSLHAGDIHPFFRSAMLKSVSPIDLAEYDTDGEIQDFLLVPKDHSHFAGTFDPYSILLIVTNEARDRIARACSFPPARTTSLGSKDKSIELTGPPSLVDDLAAGATLLSYHDFSLPFQLLAGGTRAIGGQMLTLDTPQYERIVALGKVTGESVQLEGGKAFADQVKHDEIRLTKYQPRRIMIIYGRDLRVLFYDVSAQLLVGGEQEPLRGHFPDPLAGMTVDLHTVWSELVARGKRSGVKPESIQAVYLAPDALEVATVFDTGDVIVHRNVTQQGPTYGVQTGDVTVLQSTPAAANAKMVPYFALESSGIVVTCSISDIGFLAVSYSTGVVVVVDMRGPRTIYRSGEKDKDKNRVSISDLHIGKSQVDVAKALTWSISGLDDDEVLRVRLAISRESGSTEILTLTRSGTPPTWGPSQNTKIIRGVSGPLSESTFILDGKTGSRQGATGLLLAASYDLQASTSPALLVTVGEKGVRSYANISGDRIGKADWGLRAGNAIAAQVVQRMASRALVVVTDKEEVLTYSLPRLDLITRFKLLPLANGTISIDQSGDFLAFCSSRPGSAVSSVVYGTFFDIRRAYGIPEVDFSLQPCNVPQPQPVAMGPPSLVGTWWNYKTSITGDQLDNVLGGPDRPHPPPQRPALNTAASGSIASSASTAAASVAASAAAAQTTFYNKISSALGERGQLLGGLEESFNSLEQGSRSMAAQAKRLAAQQTAKSWFGF